MRCVQDLVRISVANATDEARIGESPLQRAVFEAERRSKRIHIARENIDSARVDRTQALLAGEHMQRCTAFGAGLSEHERAIGKIEGCQILPARQLGPRWAPVQPASNHQVQHYPEIAVDSYCDSLADSAQFAHRSAFYIGDGRLCGSKQEGACQSHLFDPAPQDAGFESGDVSGNVRQFRHTGNFVAGNRRGEVTLATTC